MSFTDSPGDKYDMKSNVVCHNCKKGGRIRPNRPNLHLNTKTKFVSSKVNFVFEWDLFIRPVKNVT